MATQSLTTIVPAAFSGAIQIFGGRISRFALIASCAPNEIGYLSLADSANPLEAYVTFITDESLVLRYVDVGDIICAAQYVVLPGAAGFDRIFTEFYNI